MRIGEGDWSLKVSRGASKVEQPRQEQGWAVSLLGALLNRPAHKRSPAQETRERGDKALALFALANNPHSPATYPELGTAHTLEP